MDLAIVHSRASYGLNAPEVTIEVHLSNGLPAFAIVGLPDAAVRESKERVRSAIINSRFEFPCQRITVNLAPADLPKDGGRFDLAIAIGILVASNQIDTEELDQYEIIGELALSGATRFTHATLTAAIAAGKSNRGLILPTENLEEASLCSSCTLWPADHLLKVTAHLSKEQRLQPYTPAPRKTTHATQQALDMADVKGQDSAKRALEIAAAGAHNLLFVGPPGAGKSMLASRLPGILPPLTEQAMLEVAALKSLSRTQWGNDNATESIRGTTSQQSLEQPPFRSPHHSASAVALAGGGSHPKPGEISLAHHGVLFLDELPEFSRKALEILREPLETGSIDISRASQRVTFPAAFQLIAAMNPCPCGRPENPPESCSNPIRCCQQYQAKLSGPLMDRIDLQIKVDAVPVSQLQSLPRSTPSSEIRQRVIKARTLQLERTGKANRFLHPSEIERHCKLSSANQQLLERAANRLKLSARAFHRVLKVARTIADLDGHQDIDQQHLTEALSYRIHR